ncbi:hypothetical protein [Rhodococcus pyridinivorans]|uniref:hypothetical protein n=1 Tax=Rhodococcus pyridinivorans TaxID=103816 RepID=UPI00110D55F3|nr:hypothetical protein [Rhodococcus pyridinivorans]
MRTPVRAATAAVVLGAVAAVGIWTVGAVSGPDAAVADDGVAETGTGDYGAMPSRGVVRSWDLEHMQGVIDGDDVPGGCHVDFAAVAVDGFPALTPGHEVEFEWVRPESPAAGVEFEFECVQAWPAGQQPFCRPAGFGARAWSVHPDGRIEEEHFADEPSAPVPAPSRVTGHSVGTVREWNDEQGWGGLTPGKWTRVVDYAADASVAM